MENLTPKERVFGTLRNLQRIVDDAQDLNDERERVSVALDRCLSWEDEVIDVETPNVELTGNGATTVEDK